MMFPFSFPQIVFSAIWPKPFETNTENKQLLRLQNKVTVYTSQPASQADIIWIILILQYLWQARNVTQFWQNTKTWWLVNVLWLYSHYNHFHQTFSMNAHLYSQHLPAYDFGWWLTPCWKWGGGPVSRLLATLLLFNYLTFVGWSHCTVGDRHPQSVVGTDVKSTIPSPICHYTSRSILGIYLIVERRVLSTLFIYSYFNFSKPNVKLLRLHRKLCGLKSHQLLKDRILLLVLAMLKSC